MLEYRVVPDLAGPDPLDEIRDHDSDKDKEDCFKGHCCHCHEIREIEIIPYTLKDNSAGRCNIDAFLRVEVSRIYDGNEEKRITDDP